MLFGTEKIRFVALALAVIVVGTVEARAQGDASASADVTFDTPQTEVGVFDVWEAAVRVTSPAPGNPFTANRLVGWFVHTADGSRTSIEGFCDSPDGSLYRLRFAPRQTGDYVFTLHLDDGRRVAEQSGAFTAIAGDNPGFLRVDPNHPHHFVWEKTARHFYLLGHTAYHIANPHVPDENWISYLDHISSLGFNKVRMLISSGRSRVFWHYQIFPWTGDMDTSTYDQYDVPTWQHFERIIRAMADRGIVADVIFEVDKENLSSHFSTFDVPSDREKAFYRYAVNRFGAFTNVVWNLGNEHLEYHSQAWANAMGRYLKTIDPYDHLATAHGFSAFPYGREAWADTVCIQAYPGGGPTHPVDEWMNLFYATTATYRYEKPIVDDEYGYEVPYPPDSVRKTHWVLACSGCYGSYGSNESLTVRTDEQRLWSYEVADAQVAKVKAFFEKTAYWLLSNDQSVITHSDQPAFCVANHGCEYVVYLPNGGSVSLDLGDASGVDLPIEWIDPQTLEATPADPPSTRGASQLELQPPATGDLVLHVGKVIKDEPYANHFDDDEPSSWKVVNGTWASVDGSLQQTDPRQTADCITLVDHAFSSFIFDVDVRVADGSNRWAGVSLRKVDPNDGYWESGYLLLLRNDGTVELLEPVNRDYRSIARATSRALRPGAWNHLQVVARGGVFLVFVNGEQAFGYSIDSPTYDSGFVGLAGEGGVVEFDDVIVRPIFYEDWDDCVTDGVRAVRGNWQAQDLAFVKTGDKSPAIAAVDFPGLYEFTSSVEVTIPDANSSDFAGILLSQGPIEWPFTAPAFAIAVSNRGAAGVPTLALVRLDGSERRVLDVFPDVYGDRLKPGEMNRLVVTIAGGMLSVNVNGRLLISYQNNGGSYGAIRVGLLCGETETRFDALTVKDDQLPE
ncbi:MAG: DUF4038 domain-containing protein [Planctomycetes bacterium]|nr:DUF4038 domain-containing protein [Planctomycetota bacterium]